MKKSFYLIAYILLAVIGVSQNIQLQSLESLYIETAKDGRRILQGTGFIIKPDSTYYLITNWHMVTNKKTWDHTWVDTSNKIEPNEIYINHRSSRGINFIEPVLEKLIQDNGIKNYEEFKIKDQIIDVVAIPLKNVSSKKLEFYPLDYKNTYDGTGIIPTELITVIGYPDGVRSSLIFPIWKSGTVASEPIFDQGGLPIILVDLLGIGGMSGSPVYYVREDSDPKHGNFISGAKFFYFLGVFSHGNPNIQLGVLWKSTYLQKLFDSLD